MNLFLGVKSFFRSGFIVLLLVCAVPVRLHAQSGAPSVTTGNAGRIEGYGEGLSGTASYNGPGPVNIYTWFQWGTTTAYGNSSAQVENPQYGSMSYIITGQLQPNTVYHYQAVASDSYGTSYGADATFISAGPPAINGQPKSQTVAAGGTASFTVGASASDGVLFYQWYKNGYTNPISSATSSSFTITNAQVSDAGTYMVAVASDYGGEEPVDSSPATLTVVPGPPTAPILSHLAFNTLTASFGFSFTNVSGAHFSVYGTTNLLRTNWIYLGTATENPLGSYSSYSFSDTNTFTNHQRFYKVTSP